MKIRKSGGWILWVVLACAAWTSAYAAPLSLDVKGKIARTNDAMHQVFHFSEADLLALPAHSITTTTTWTPKSTFTGPLLGDILKAVGATGTQVEIHSLDDYTYTVPVTDADHYGAIVAYSMNGTRLKASNYGPLFLIYPRDEFPELVGASADSKFVWQIKSLIIK